MYETHFGLKKRPFRALALGNDVFIGPQAATTMAALKKGLATSDAIVALSGPIGAGKTTVVGRALDGISEKRKIVMVGRIKLGHDELLELLLAELGVEDLPPGTVQRFALFRRLLKKFDEQETRTIIVVEDAGRIGVDALSELEALTGADAGVSGGASVVLMGDEGLGELLRAPQLGRVRQRLRVRQQLAPLTAKELLAYFKHCFRLAGGAFDSVFDDASATLLHDLSGGVPRMANNLVDSALASAAEAGDKRVSPQRIREIAADEFGLEVGQTELSTPAVIAAAPAAGPAAATLDPVLPTRPPLPTNESLPVAPAAGPSRDSEIPELIQDTLPELEVLAPELADARAGTAPLSATARTNEPAPATIPRTPPTPKPASAVREEIPRPPLQPATRVNAAVPDWERDPTLAELRPDLDALEHAMAIAQGTDADDADLPVLQPTAKPKAAPEVVPEITLDREIQQKIEEAAQAIKRTEEAAAAKAAADAEAAKSIDLAATGEIRMDLPPLKMDLRPPETRPRVDPAPASKPRAAAESDAKDNEEMRRIAADLSKARTLDDVDDKMAETLFGEEFSAIAAQIASKVSGSPANEDLELEEDVLPPARHTPTEKRSGNGAAGINADARPNRAKPQIDEAASKRLATVRALNGSSNAHPPPNTAVEAIAMGHDSAASLSQQRGDHPQSIEDQIEISMTATLQALKARPAGHVDEDDEAKRGFFSRFRRT